MKRLIILGAGGHGRVIADIAEKTGKYTEICFLDDADIKKSGGYDVVGKIIDYKKFKADTSFIVAIGNAALRKKIQTELESENLKIDVLIHPAAVIGDRVDIECGSVVMSGAVINVDAKIGKGVIINTNCTVEHDCVIKDFAHISVGANLAGTVIVGENCMVCAGATVINNINICDNCIIGAGSVVVDNIIEEGTYIGVPARKMQ